MGAEQSRTVGQKLIDFSQQVAESTTDHDKLGELIHDALQTLPIKVQKDIRTLIRSQRQHRVSGSTTLSAVPIVTIPNIILSNPNINPAEFFDCQLKFTGLCNYISDIGINSETNVIRLRFALKQFYLTLSSWGRDISKLEDQLREKGDTLPAKSTRSDWKKEGLAYKKFVDVYGHGILFVLPFSRKESRDFDFKQLQKWNKLQAAKVTALSCEETGKTFSRYLAEKQHADGLYSEIIARAEDRGSGQTYGQPSVNRSLVHSGETQHITASSLPVISNEAGVSETANSARQAEVAIPSSQDTPSRCQDDLSSVFSLSAHNNSPAEASRPICSDKDESLPASIFHHCQNVNSVDPELCCSGAKGTPNEDNVTPEQTPCPEICFDNSNIEECYVIEPESTRIYQHHKTLHNVSASMSQEGRCEQGAAPELSNSGLLDLVVTNASPYHASMHKTGFSSLFYDSSNANSVDIASTDSTSPICLPAITGPSTPQLQSKRSEQERSSKRQKTQHGALLRRLSLPADDETSRPRNDSRTSHHSDSHLSKHDMNLGDCAVESAEYNLDYTQDENILMLSLAGGQYVSSANTSPLCLGAVKDTSAPSSFDNGPLQNAPDPDAEFMPTEATSQPAILESMAAAQNPCRQVCMSTSPFHYQQIASLPLISPSHALTGAELVPNVPSTMRSREQQGLPPVRLLLDAVDGRTQGDQESTIPALPGFTNLQFKEGLDCSNLPDLLSNTQNNIDVQGLDFGGPLESSFCSSDEHQVEQSLNLHFVANLHAENNDELNGLTLHHQEGCGNQAVTASQRNANPKEMPNFDGNIDQTPTPMSSQAWVNAASDEFTIPEEDLWKLVDYITYSSEAPWDFN